MNTSPSQLLPFMICGLLCGCGDPKSVDPPGGGELSGGPPQNVSSAAKPASSYPLAEVLKIGKIDPELYAFVRSKISLEECDDELLVQLMSGSNKWPVDWTREDILTQLKETYPKYLKMRAEVARRQVKADPEKVRTMAETEGNKRVGSLFGFSITGAPEYLERLRSSGDPGSLALADYLERRAAKENVLPALESLHKTGAAEPSMELELAELLLKGGRGAEALELIKQFKFTGEAGRLEAAVKALCQRYMTEVGGKSPLEAETAVILMPGATAAGVPTLDSSAYRAIAALLDVAKSEAQSKDAGSAYAAAALSIAQAMENSQDVFVRIMALDSESRALKAIPEDQQRQFLNVDWEQWEQQLALEKAEYASLIAFYKAQRKAWESGQNAAQYAEYTALANETGQVEALRKLKAMADAKVDLFEPSSVGIPR